MGREYLLCVDDEAIILESLKRELRGEFEDEYEIAAALSGQQALATIEELAAEGSRLAVIVCDQRMPGMDGSELLARVKRAQPDAIGIMLTGYTDVAALKQAINDASLFRFLTKPWNPLDLRSSCRQAIELRRETLLSGSLMRQLEALNATMASILESVIDCRDPQTYDHIRMVASFSAEIAREAGLDACYRKRLLVFSTLHDLGKVGIPGGILNKPGRLEPAEMEIMKEHVLVGARLVRGLIADPILEEIVLHHHERWDGAGYPEGLAGESIPLAARIVAIADVLDALVSARPYKKALGFDDAAAIVEARSPGQFDPSLVEAFKRSRDRLKAIAAGATHKRDLGSSGL